jgi:hypothetical protein
VDLSVTEDGTEVGGAGMVFVVVVWVTGIPRVDSSVTESKFAGGFLMLLPPAPSLVAARVRLDDPSTLSGERAERSRFEPTQELVGSGRDEGAGTNVTVELDGALYLDLDMVRVTGAGASSETSKEGMSRGSRYSRVIMVVAKSLTTSNGLMSK